MSKRTVPFDTPANKPVVDICHQRAYSIIDICQKGAAMPRPVRCRMIERYPEHWTFAPEAAETEETIQLTLDEYETIRQIDKIGLTQEQCAEEMGVARTTVTAIYDSARKKVAEALIDGKTLQIGGGSYRLKAQGAGKVRREGDAAMRIAVTYENGEVFQHFGHTEQFKLFDVTDGRITESQVVDTNGAGHGALAGFLKEADADALICGGIGPGAQNALAEAGITLYAGVQGSADAAAEALAKGTLSYAEDATCDHHGHHEEGHGCHHEEHDCGHGECVKENRPF